MFNHDLILEKLQQTKKSNAPEKTPYDPSKTYYMSVHYGKQDGAAIIVDIEGLVYATTKDLREIKPLAAEYNVKKVFETDDSGYSLEYPINNVYSFL